MKNMYSRQDYSVIKSNVEKIKDDYNLFSSGDAFYFLTLDLLFNLQSEEIQDCITDSEFLSRTSDKKGHDRGIDAVYIDYSQSIPTVHLFNFKYVKTYENTLNNFPGNEIDKILGFINHLFQGVEDGSFKSSMNLFLYEKVLEIWGLFDTGKLNFKVHLVSNISKQIENIENKRFFKQLKIQGIELGYLLASDIVDKITGKNKKEINANIQVSKKELFEQSSGDIRALIVNLRVIDCIRIVLDDEEIRMTSNLGDNSGLEKFEICEDAFDDNVRVYLKQKPRINQNIKKTVLSDERNRFFYYNNGITITCSQYTYNSNLPYPVIELKDIQIVNGSQTIHALYDALKENYNKLEDANLLCRIYEIKDKEVSGKIAQYTNSQNPVNNRDIKSIDYIQLKLEYELRLKGYFYERKKNQYSSESKDLRLDSEKIGQILMSFYNKKPYEAKNSKARIFAQDYDIVFPDDINADKILLAHKIYEYIEKIKNKSRSGLFEDERIYHEKSYIIYSSLYIMYVLSDLATENDIELSLVNYDRIIDLYPNAIQKIESINKLGKEKARGENRSFAFNTFFKSPLPISLYEDLKLRSNNPKLILTTQEEIDDSDVKYELINSRKMLRATGIPIGKEFKVFAGSQSSSTISKSLTGSVNILREDLLTNGIIELQGDKYIFLQDHIFSSPSLASNIINGYSSNGKISWKDGQGKSLKDNV